MAKLISAIAPLESTSVTDLTTGELLNVQDWNQPVQALMEYVQEETKYLYTAHYSKFEQEVLVASKIGSMNSFARQRGYKSRYKSNLDAKIRVKSRVNELILHKFASETISYIQNPNPRKQPPTFSSKINLGAVDKQMVTIALEHDTITMVWKVWDRELAFEFKLPSYVLKRSISKLSLPTVEYHKGKIVFIFTIQEIPKERHEGNHLAGVDLGRVEPYTLAITNKAEKRIAHYTTSSRLKNLNAKRERVLIEKKHILNKIASYTSLGLNTEVLVKEKQRKTSKIKAIGVSLAHQVGAEIAYKLDKHKIDILHIENLKWVTGAKYGSKWNHSKQQDSIQHAVLRNGIRTKKVNPKNTSQHCYKCNTQLVHNTKKRTVWCVECKTKLDRDFNAAMNIALDKNSYPTINRVSGDNCSAPAQVVNQQSSDSIVAVKPAIVSFTT